MSTRAPISTAEGPVYAAIDLGTNNCRLLIAASVPEEFARAHEPAIESKNAEEPEEDAQHRAPAFRVIDSFSRIVRLGEGVSASGKLSKDAMERTLSALSQCQKKIARHGVVHGRYVATEACRRAHNAPEFLRRVEEEIGLRIDIISTEEEARLAFLGCASLLTQSARRAIVFDIGGGSTELMWVDVDHAASPQAEKEPSRAGRGITDWLSIDCGVMNLADRFGGQGFADLAFRDMVEHVESRIGPFDEANQIGESLGNARVQMLSTSGTVTTLAAIHLGLPRYDRTRIDGIKLKVKDIRATTQKLLAMRPSERFHHPCIGPDRADYILSGCAIFEAISNVWPTGEITIADRGVREGIIISLLQHHG